MKHNLYVIRDVVSGQSLGLGYAPTDGAFMRDTLATFLRMRPLNELEYYNVGSYDDESMEITSSPKTKCSNEAYKYPETRSKSLSAEDVKRLAEQLQANETKGE